MYAQPLLYVPPVIERGLSDGTLKLFGSVVRDADKGFIVKHLNDAVPTPEQVESTIRRIKFNQRVVVVALASTVAGAATAYVINRRRKKGERVTDTTVPECVASFESSLRAYVDAGRAGALDADIIDTLIRDLDEVKSFSENTPGFTVSLEDLVPLFDLVIAHTERLAEAYHVELDAVDGSAGGVVVSLRRHLEAQRSILDATA